MNDWDKKPLLRPSEEGQSPIRVSILGDFVLSNAGGRQFLIATKKNRALLAILALSPGFQATRERLCGLLWGDRGEDQARSSLRQSLAVLRKELGGVEDLVLKTHDDIVALRRDTAQVDAIDFLALSNDSGITTLRQAAKLYRGELLSDTSIRDAAFEDWLSAERSRLRTVAIKIFDRLIPLEEGHSRIVAAQQLVSFDPLRESSHRLLMQAYADQGDNGLALKQFELCRKLLHEELSVEPARETLELMRRISDGDRKSTKQENAQTEPSQAMRAEDFPSIAVLPFVNLSGNRQHDYFADGITEDITTELSRFKGLFVIARNSAFSFKAKSIAIATIANELGVRFLLEGSVQRSGDRVRVTARLVDAATGREAWSERYDRVIEDIFAVQDDVVRTIVATLEGQLASAVASQSRRQTPSNVLAYECVLQARKFLDVYDAHSAEPLLRRAIAADPRYAQAHAWMAMVYWVKFFQNHQDRDIAEAVAFGKTAVALDPGDSVCHLQLGFAYIFSRQLELADIHSLKALELNPADMLALGLRAQLMCRLGRSQEAIEALDQLVQHDPFPPNWYWENRSIVLLTLDKFAEALAAIQHIPELFWWNHGYVAICYARLGQIKEAQDAIKRAIELRPELTIQRFMMGEPFKLPEDAKRMIEGLRMAGLAEHAAVSSTRSGTKPSIAVLSFANLSGDAQQDYLADGLAEDVIAGLSRFSSLAVISQNSPFRFHSGSTDAKLVGKELGVQYLVAGSLRRIGQRIRISAQLTDTASGVQLWSEKYERNVEDFLEVQDDVVRAIATTFEHRIADIRAQEISNQPAATWEAYDHFLQARQLMSHYSNYPAAEAPLLRAIALDPSFSEAHARLAHVAMSKYWANGDRKHVEEAFRYAKTSIKLNDRDSAAHAAMSLASAFMNKYDLAFLHADRALELNPNNMLAAKNRAMWQVLTGKSLEALAAFDTILERDPYPTPNTWELKGAALFQLRRYEEAIKVFAMIPELQYWDRAYLIASHTRLGNTTDAKNEISALLQLYPEFSISRVFQTENYADEDSREHLRRALLEAGLPE